VPTHAIFRSYSLTHSSFPYAHPIPPSHTYSHLSELRKGRCSSREARGRALGLTSIPPHSPLIPLIPPQAANLRKLVLAMSQDIRVLVIKLTDRLHNMRTIGHVASQRSKRLKAEETIGG
jgi:(p)ppGpp synthase/HD superfamily hydrolase